MSAGLALQSRRNHNVFCVVFLCYAPGLGFPFSVHPVLLGVNKKLFVLSCAGGALGRAGEIYESSHCSL